MYIEICTKIKEKRIIINNLRKAIESLAGKLQQSIIPENTLLLSQAVLNLAEATKFPLVTNGSIVEEFQHSKLERIRELAEKRIVHSKDLISVLDSEFEKPVVEGKVHKVTPSPKDYDKIRSLKQRFPIISGIGRSYTKNEKLETTVLLKDGTLSTVVLYKDDVNNVETAVLYALAKALIKMRSL